MSGNSCLLGEPEDWVEKEKDLLGKPEDWQGKDLLDLSGGFSATTACTPYVGLRVASGSQPPPDHFAHLMLFGGHATVPSKDLTVVRTPKNGKCTRIYHDGTECGKKTRMECEDRCRTCAETCCTPACGMLVHSTKDTFGCITFRCAECRRRENSRR